MKKVFWSFLLLVSMVFADDPFFSDRLLFCLRSNVPSIKTGKIDKRFTSGHPGIDRLIQKYNFIHVEKWLSSADENDQIDGVNLSKIYRVKLNAEKKQSEIDNIIDDLKLIPDINSADRESRYRLHQPPEPYIPSDPYFSQQWYLKKIMADAAWALWGDQVPGDSTIIVGVVDSGIDFLHPDLASAMYLNPGEDIDGDGQLTSADSNDVDDDENGYVDDFMGWDFVGGYMNGGDFPDNDIRPPDSGPYDELSHGTHVAGAMAAATDNGLGIAGIGFNCRILGTKNSYDDNLTDVYIENGYDGILYCAKMGADIINCSWGGPGSSFYGKYVIDQAVNYGAIVVCAAGNGGDDGVGDNNDNDHHYPSDYDKTIAVSALNVKDKKSIFSNYGEVIDISAPGVGIYSTIHWGQGNYASWDGTSMASPIVAGAFALLKAFYPDSSRDWLIETLLSHADPIDEENPSYAEKLGSGRVNVYNAIAGSIYPKIEILEFSINIIDDNGNGNLNPGEEATLLLSLKNDELWSFAEDVRVIIRSEDQAVSIIDSTAFFSNMDKGDTTANNLDEIRFLFKESGTYKPLEISVQITANDTTDNPYLHEDSITIIPSNSMPGFPLTNISVSVPLGIDNVYGDSLKEIIAVGDNDSLYIIDANGNILPGFPVDLVSYTTMAPIIADMDADGDKEIAIINRNGLVKIINADGSLRFQMDTGEIFRGDASAANMDEDPELELIFGTYENKLHVLKLDSTEVEGFPVLFPNRIKKGPAIADIDMDDIPEIIFGVGNNELHVLTATGDSLNPFPVTLTDDINAPPVVAEYDGNHLIIFPQKDQKMMIIDTAANIVAEYIADGDIKQPASLTDINDDSVPEIIFISSDNKLHAMDFTGTLVDSFPIDLGGVPLTAPVLANLDEDNIPEIVLGTVSGNLEIYNQDGSVLDNFPAVLGGELEGTPSISDLDNDGDPEIVVGGNQALYVLDIASAIDTSAYSWRTYLGNNRRTGYYQDLLKTTSIERNAEIPQRFRLFQNYPNPFNPVTNISFDVPAECSGKNIRLEIYNILGQKVKTLFNGKLPAGRHTHQWQGRNEVGQRISSGFYFIRLSASDIMISKKMLLIK